MTSLHVFPLITDVRALIEGARNRVATVVNAELTMLYWQIDHLVRTHVLGDERAGYGEEVIARLAETLTHEYGRGYSTQNLHHMVRFAEAFPDEQIVSALRRELSWSHMKEVVYFHGDLQRNCPP